MISFSAAFCFNEKESNEIRLARDVVAIFGAHNLSNSYETGRFQLSPKKIIIHDDWDPRTKEFDADLALLEFEAESIHLNSFVQPICLWDSEDEPTVTEGIVIGWGKSEDSSKIHENIPKKLTALIRRTNECFKGQYYLIAYASPRTFCASIKNGSGVCHGDGGGGFFIEINKFFYLRGIISSAQTKAWNECDVSISAFYTNVLKFRDWIGSKTGLLKQGED